MFRFLKRLIKLALLILLIAFVLMIFLPSHYDVETSIEIPAPKEQVFSKAETLKQWNVLAMYGTNPLKGWGFVPELSRQPPVGAVRLDSIVSGVETSLRVTCEVIRTEPPDLIVYRVVGGPTGGSEPEITFLRLDADRTKVSVKEPCTFHGFFGSTKALLMKKGIERLNEASLENLKNLCATRTK